MQGDKIKKFSIGKEHNPFVIAEMSGNHNGSLERALAIVDAAAAAGVNALKIQTYTAETMTLDLHEGEFYIDDPSSLWNGQSLYSLYQQAYTPWEWHEPIFARCSELGIIGFSTPFDETAVDFLESLNVPCYKIASFEMTDLNLIAKVAKTGKTMIISTGMATVGEIDETVRIAKDNGCPEVILLKCTSTYPANAEDSNLLTIPHMRQLFQCEIGLSDHTLGIGAALASVALGATVIEKHFTLCRAEGGVDSAFSLEPSEMKMLVEGATQAWRALGTIKYGPTKREKLSGRRSLYVVKDIKKGETFTKENIKTIRPGYGLEPKYLELVLGRRAKSDIKMGTPFSWEMF